ncbi:MAG: hypothetical protein WBC67_03605 [Candidatus Acidiferrales bacterium]
MKFFDAPDANYPRKWGDYSLDFRLMFIYHGCMMVLFVAGQSLSAKSEILIAAFAAAVLVSVSVRHRREMNWHWRGANAKNVLAGLGGMVLTGVFLFAGSPLFPPSDHRFLPWYLAGIGIAVFGVLGALNVVGFSKAEFLKECQQPGTSASSTTAPRIVAPMGTGAAEPSWKRIVRAAFMVFFFLVWLDGVASFYFFGVAFRDGSPAATATKTEPRVDHGQIVFVASSQKALVDGLQTVMSIGMPVVFVLGFIVHFVGGVKLLPNAPTFSEWRANRYGVSRPS